MTFALLGQAELVGPSIFSEVFPGFGKFGCQGACIALRCSHVPKGLLDCVEADGPSACFATDPGIFMNEGVNILFVPALLLAEFGLEISKLLSLLPSVGELKVHFFALQPLSHFTLLSREFV